MEVPMNESFRWVVGIDWAKELHTVALQDNEGRSVAERNLAHSGADLAAFCRWLIEKTGAEPGEIALAIETPRGPIVDVLLERGFKVFSINPKQLDRFRDRFTVAGAKDDSRDAKVLARSLCSDPQAFRLLRIEDALVIELRAWLRIHDELTQDRTRLSNRMGDQLWRYYPQIGDVTDDLAATWFLDLWELVPTPGEAARLSEKKVARILKSHRIRRFAADEVLQTLRRQPLAVAPGTTEAATAYIRSVVARLRGVYEQLKEADRRLEEITTAIEAKAEGEPGQICEQRDVAILRSMPGLGRISVAALLSEASEPLRRREYSVLRLLTGAAPVTRRSGKSRYVVRRLACHRRLRNALYYWAYSAVQHDPVSRKRYEALRQRGHGKARALRSVGDRLLYVLCTCLQRQTLYDPNVRSTQSALAA
jgi:transposase